MGHRHMCNAPQNFDNESDQGWNHAEHPYMPIARGAPESSTIIPSVDNVTIQGGHYPPHWNPPPRSSGYSSSIPNDEFPRYQPMPIAPGPSRDPFLHQSAAGNPHMFQDNYSHHPSSSNVGGKTITGFDDGFQNQAIGNGRGSYKRKSPSMPSICERGSTSRYYDVGSSSDIHLPADPWQEKQISESYHTSWEYSPNYGVNSLSIGGEGTMRNVRSRAAVDQESNPSRTHLSSNSLHPSFPSRPSDQSNSVDFWGQNSNAPSWEWNRYHVLPAAHGVTFGSDSGFFSHEPSSLNILNSHPNSSVEIGANNNDVTSNRNHVPPNVGGHLNQPVRGVRSGYGQRSTPTFRASSSNFRPRYAATSDEVHHIAESYHPRHPRVFSNLRLRNVDRNVRTCISSDRYRYSNEEASFRDRLTPAGLMVMDQTAVYGSRSLFDQHRDMRLDVDNMSYEELLVLGERIGSVSTGLSDGLISKCLTESIYCSSDPSQDKGTCVICLEEYNDMDVVGTLKACGHDFHVGCIRKWLSMKNSCPICKASAMDDSNKNK